MRRLTNILTGVSLLLLLAALALWPATHFAGHRAVRLSSAPGFGRFLVLGGGGIYLVTQQATLPADGSWTVDVSRPGDISVHGSASSSEVVLVDPTGAAGGATLRAVSFRLTTSTYANFAPPPGRLGFASASSGPSRMMFNGPTGAASTCAISTDMVGVPFWAVAAASAVAPGVWATRHIRGRRARNRAARGQCIHCGYDLRASPARCPECGAATSDVSSGVP